MGRTLSSDLTPFWKFVFPTCIIGFLGAFTVTAIAYPERIDGGRTWQLGVSLLFSWPIAAIVCHQMARLRRVRVTEAGLLVSNYLREILVPWTMIADVEWVHRRRGPWYVHLSFRQHTALGRRTMFLPRWGWGSEDIVAELRHRAGLDVPSSVRDGVHL